MKSSKSDDSTDCFSVEQLPISFHIHVEMGKDKPETVHGKKEVERLSLSGHDRRPASVRAMSTEAACDERESRHSDVLHEGASPSFSEKSTERQWPRLVSSLSGHRKKHSNKNLATLDEDGTSVSFGENGDTTCDETKQLHVQSKTSADCRVSSVGSGGASLTKTNSPPRMGLRRNSSLRILMRANNEDADCDIVPDEEAEASKKTQVEPTPSKRGYFGRSKSSRLLMGSDKENASTENHSPQRPIGALRRNPSRKSSLRYDERNEIDPCIVESDAGNNSKRAEVNPTETTRSRRGCFGRSKSMRLLTGGEAEDLGGTKLFGSKRMGLRRQSSRRLTEIEDDPEDGENSNDVRSGRMKQPDSRSCNAELAEKIKQSRQKSLRKSQSLDDSGDVAEGNTRNSQRSNMLRSKSFRLGSSYDQQKPVLGNISSNGQSRSFRMSLRSDLEQIDDTDNQELKLDSPESEVEKEVTTEPDAGSHGENKSRRIDGALCLANFLWSFIIVSLKNPAVKRLFNYTLDLFLFVACKATSLAFWLLAFVVDGIRIASQWLINQEVVRKTLVAVYTQGESIKQKKTN